jgi:uncharacterized membrane-anchored protein YhcB (DUF1043 family)
MTLPQWNLLINAWIVALMIGYGFWIKHIVSQQQKLHDAAIQSLQATIASKNAEISRLKGDTAPNIVKAYKKVRDHADKMSADVLKLEKKIQIRDVKSHFIRLIDEATGFASANHILIDELKKYVRPTGDLPTQMELWSVIQEVSGAVAEQSDVRIEKVKLTLGIVDGDA